MSDSPPAHEPVIDTVYALAASADFDAAGKGSCYAARESGLYRSSDGTNWENAYDALNLNSPLTTTAVSLLPGGAVFAGVHGGVLRSEDGRVRWDSSALASPPPVISSLNISPDFERDGVLLAATLEDGIFRSDDRGRRWTPWNFGLLDLNVLCLALSPDFAQDEMVYAGTETGIFISTNGGRAWREVDFPLEHSPVLCLGSSPNYGHDGIILAGTESGELFRSVNYGVEWVRVGDVLPAPLNSLCLSPRYPSEPSMMILCGDTLLASADDGQTWRAVEGSPAGQQVTAVTAPKGAFVGAPLLVGLMSGHVLFTRL
jgi:photosystem II stability/assembly factor-like uncharacterized protein